MRKLIILGMLLPSVAMANPIIVLSNPYEKQEQQRELKRMQRQIKKLEESMDKPVDRVQPIINTKPDTMNGNYCGQYGCNRY